MVRMDENMPFLLQYENVAWYENGKVRILDRRIYPTEVRFVECATYQEVVQAIADMVTQSAGPYRRWHGHGPGRVAGPGQGRCGAGRLLAAGGL